MVIEIDSIHSPTLLQFKKSRVVVPIRMLRIFVEDADVRPTPVDEPVPAVPVPQPINESPVGWSPWTDGQIKISGEDLTYTEDAIDKFELSPSDIERIRAAIQNMTKDETQTDVLFHVPTPKSNILSCRGLSRAPIPDMIADVFSAVLGDVFHAMDRKKSPCET